MSEETKPCEHCRSFYDIGMGAVIHENNCSALAPQPDSIYEVRYVHGGAPTDCVDYGVISHATGKEVCRVWERDDAELIARLLNAHPVSSPPQNDAGVEGLREALGQIASKNDLSGVPDNELESAVRHALYECEILARTALEGRGS